MNPIDFEGSNVVFGKDQPEYLPLPAYRFPDGVVVSCWELTEEEKDHILKTGRVWVYEWTGNLTFRPIFVEVVKPQTPLIYEE